MRAVITITTIFATVLMLAPSLSQAQACHNFHRKNCQASDNAYFEYNGQSKSALFKKGQTSELNIIIYKGQDYRVSVCTEPELGDRIEFRLKDSKSGEILYDNADTDYDQEFEFTCSYSRRIVLVVTVPDGETKAKKLKAREMACIGVLVEHMTTPKSGF
jgi:hypothetical protein